MQGDSCTCVHVCFAGNIHTPGSTVSMQNVSVFIEGSAADGSEDQLLGSLTGSSNSLGVPSLLLGAANGVPTAPIGGESPKQ